ncbi:MAG TPA: hypothetical protein VGL22_19545 [Terracidiphilus sp.]
MSAAAALVIAVALAGCGQTTYFAGRSLPPSRLTNRVLVAIQNPGGLNRGALEILDGYYDTRFAYNSTTKTFVVSGYSGALPSSIQNMPEEQLGVIYGSGDGSLALIDYQKESTGGTQSGLNGASSSIYMTRNKGYVFAASQSSQVLTVLDRNLGGSYALSLPGVYRVSVNPGGTAALAFVQNSNYAYYPVRLNGSQTIAYSGGPATWPKAAVDCEPQNAPGWCLYQAQSPDSTDATGTYTGRPLLFDRPVKAVFSNDGGTAYVLSCGRECGGTHAGINPLPVAPLIFQPNQASGKLPTRETLNTIAIAGGASNALIDSSTMYVVGQQLQKDGLFAGRLTTVNLNNLSVSAPVSISDGEPGAVSRMIESDDNTLWIGMSKCTNGERFATGQDYGCLTMFDTSAGAVKLIEPFHGDATGIASVTGLHKIYTAEGGQVYIYVTSDGHALNNQYVTVTGTAYDVAYMDGLSDANNTVY